MSSSIEIDFLSQRAWEVRNIYLLIKNESFLTKKQSNMVCMFFYSDIAQRLSYNLTHFQSNYIIIILGLLIYCM